MSFGRLFASSITGVPGLRPGGITLKNIDLTLKGGGTAADAAAPVEEAEKSYPENRMFGTMLPAYGFYVRHADGIRFENVRTRLYGGREERPGVVTDDCTDVTFDDACSFEPSAPGAGSQSGCADLPHGGYTMEHTAIDVADPVATARWWVENLGFEITRQRDDETHTTFIVDRTGRIALELYRAKDAPKAPDYHAMRPLQLHFGFLSGDVDADIERLTAAGATLVVHEKAPGFDGAMMKDPSGISIQFVKRGKPVLKGCRR